MNIRQLLADQAEKYKSKPAIVFQEQAVSFKELHESVIKLARIFKNFGIKKSDKVGIFLPNCLENVYSYLACFCLGAVAVPLDYMLKENELESCLGHAEVNILVAQAKQGVHIDSLKSKIPRLKKIIYVEGSDNNENSMKHLMSTVSGDLPVADINGSDPALIMYTSGTTGQPKGILLNYRHLEGSPAAMHHFVDLTDKDVKLAALPLSHIGGFIYIQNCISFGITLILMDRFNPFEFLSLIAKHKVTCFHIVPAMYNAILTLKQIDQFDLSSLRWVVVFGAPSSPEMLERFHKYCPNAQLLNGWGMTETCPPNVVTPFGCKNIASVGKPSPHCKIKIVNEEGLEVPNGEIGELIISGWVVMDSYYKDPAMTASVLKDGWLYTGDLARLDKDGFLYIVGRKKEMIKVAGQIVYAPEVEVALSRHPDVVEVAVIGIEDELRGESIKAFVALKPGSRLTPEELRYFARENLANFKVPQIIELLPELPKNRTGKIDKELLKMTLKNT